MEDVVIAKLIKLAKEETFYDDEDEDKCIYDYSGSNVDDAYGMGEGDGRVLLAREILTVLGIDW